jgi:hypothetical protein
MYSGAPPDCMGPMIRTPLLAAFAALLLAAPANAAFKTATFTGTLTGTQVTTWHYEDPDETLDPCDGASTGDGSQTIRFTAKQLKVAAMKGAMTQRRTMIAPMIKGRAVIDREGDYAVRPTMYMEELCGPAVDGGGGPGDPLAKDCGERPVGITMLLSHNPSEPEVRAPRQAMHLSGELDPWLGFVDCPWWIGGSDDGPDEFGLLPSFEKFNDSRLYDRRRKRLTVAGARTLHHSAEHFTGKTLVTWTLRLRRTG